MSEGRDVSALELSLPSVCSGRLNACKLTVKCCETLSHTIGTSCIRELDLSNNPLEDAGMAKLWQGLTKANLEMLRSVLLSSTRCGLQVSSACLFLPVQVEELQPDAGHFPARGFNHQLRLLQAETAGPLGQRPPGRRSGPALRGTGQS